MISPRVSIRHWMLIATLGVGGTLAYLIGANAGSVNHRFGFPLDDPWIHLQFAGNLHDYGSFSYFKNEMVTAGSTSPLYTFLLAIGFFITSQEMILSYTLGTALLLVAAFFFHKIVALRFDSPFAALSPLLLLLEPRMQWAALSGMETTLFIALLLACLHYYQVKQGIAFGVAGGLLVWARPEAVIFLAAILVDAVYEIYWVKHDMPRKKNVVYDKPSLRWLRTGAIILAIFSLLYIGFNLYLSGSIFPNTVAAKLKYYGGGTHRNFPGDVLQFLTEGHMLPVAILSVIGVGAVAVRVSRRLSVGVFVPLAFSTGMFLAYWIRLPYLYQEGRYLMPIIPFVLLLAVSGIEWVVALGAKAIRRKSRESFVTYATTFLILVLSVQNAAASWERRSLYAETCKYISDRQVRTAHWLRSHTPEDAIVGTHDIGAIAFYSGRKIADMVGLVSPEAIEGIGSYERLMQFLTKKNVTHLAVLRNWFEIVNQPALFRTNERFPEIMEVFEFKPGRTHFTPHSASAAVAAAAQHMYQGQFGAAEDILRRAAMIDPQNAKVHHLLASLFMSTNRLEEAAGGFGEALKLNPDFLESQIGLAQVALRQGRRDEGVALLESIAENNPEYPTVFRALADVFSADARKSGEYLKRYEELSKERQENTGGAY